MAKSKRQKRWEPRRGFNEAQRRLLRHDPVRDLIVAAYDLRQRIEATLAADYGHAMTEKPVAKVEEVLTALWDTAAKIAGMEVLDLTSVIVDD